MTFEGGRARAWPTERTNEFVKRARINVWVYCGYDYWRAIWSNGEKASSRDARAREPQQTVERTKKDYRLLVFFNRQNAMILFFRSLAPLTCNFSYIYIFRVFFSSFRFFFLFVLCSHSTASTSFSFCVHISSSPFFHFFSILCEEERERAESERTAVSERMGQSECVVWFYMSENRIDVCLYVYMCMLGYVCMFSLYSNWSRRVCTVCVPYAMPCIVRRRVATLDRSDDEVQQWKRTASKRTTHIRYQKGWSEKKSEKNSTTNERKK